ncbi:MAG: chromate efflux transporter [Chitinophagaceae bacterium]
MTEQRTSLSELVKLFTKLGLVAFGGPAAHIAMMQHEVVTKRKWMSEQHFLDLIGATNLIPGPNSTEMAIHIGQEKAGWKGLLIAGACFILPAVLITGFIAWLYKQYGLLPQIRPFVYGINPVIIAVILAAIFPLAKTALKTVELFIIGLAALILSVLGFNEIYILFSAGLFSLMLAGIRSKKENLHTNNIFSFTLLQVSGTTLISLTNLNLFFIFLKIGAILYGSGYVLFAFLDTELVAKGLLSRQQLIDAIAVGQFTPGPVFSAVTFIGYQINDWSGAAIATIGIFLPAFIFVALLNPLVKKIRSSKLFSAFLDAVNIASVALIIAVCYKMGKETITDWRTIVIAVLGILVTFGFRKINSALIILGGSLLGYLLTLF